MWIYCDCPLSGAEGRSLSDFQVGDPLAVWSSTIRAAINLAFRNHAATHVHHLGTIHTSPLP